MKPKLRCLPLFLITRSCFLNSDSLSPPRQTRAMELGEIEDCWSWKIHYRRIQVKSRDVCSVDWWTREGCLQIKLKGQACYPKKQQGKYSILIAEPPTFRYR